MAGSQITTSVSILNSLKGFQAVSLTEYNTSAAAAVASGSVVEIAGAYFTFTGDETINASSWTSVTTGTTAYIELTPAGTAGSQVITAAYSSTAPTWRDDLQGWYASAASNVRVIGSVYKSEATSYTGKSVVLPLQQNYSDNYKWRGETELITSGSGNWTVPANVYKIRVTCVGGGGGGGSAVGGAASDAGGGGGGSGTLISLALAETLDVTPGDVKAYSVGSGGAGGAAGGAVGAVGGNTTFTGATTGIGGNYGGIGQALTNGEGGAAVGVGGDAGEHGHDGSANVSAKGGKGGGAGGRGGGLSNPGNGGYGGGGGGARAVSSMAGGNGGSGIIIIEY